VVWTTFGPDQVDLDYRQPQVLLEMIDVMLGTIGRGAEVIRLDAVAYVGKRSGTTCLHLPETHAIVQLLRLAVRRTAPWVRLITETNVPHQDGLSYLGDGDEADMIYAFALPPLVIYALTSGDAQPLADWVDSLAALPAETTLVNFVASHDGIGLNAAAGLLTDDQVAGLIHRARLAGSVSYRSIRSRGDQPYELNVNLLDLLAGVAPDAPLPEDSIPRFLCAHAILLSLAGVPAVYFHSQVGSRGDVAGVRRTGRLRSINREKLDHLRIEQELSDPTSQRRRVFDGMAALLRVRRATPAFDPWAPQRLIGELPTSVFGIERTSRDGRQRVVCLHEVAGTATQVVAGHGSGRDLLSREPIPLDHVRLRPYQARWIEVVP
jgi:sucrose phosphorylase